VWKKGKGGGTVRKIDGRLVVGRCRYGRRMVGGRVRLRCFCAFFFFPENFAGTLLALPSIG
jgi:hypothetical protein